MLRYLKLDGSQMVCEFMACLRKLNSCLPASFVLLANRARLFFLFVLLVMTLVVVLRGVLAFVLSLSCLQALRKFQTLKILHKLIPRPTSRRR